MMTKLPCVNIAPLEEPVVPPVYCRQAMSACLTETGRGVGDTLNRSCQAIVEVDCARRAALRAEAFRLLLSERLSAVKFLG